MSALGGKWEDLAVRMTSGAVIAGIGLVAMWLGGLWFHALVALICAVMVWELARMLGAEGMALWLGGIAGAAMMIAGELPLGLALPLVIAPALIGLGGLSGERTVFSLFTVMILLAGFGLMALRDDFGFLWMAWLAIVVIVTDIAGYFAGRFLGGPKFWPRVSPKKTWSGTVAGWVAAGLVGWIFMSWTEAGWQLIGLSVAIAMAGQLGDISESAVKRHAGVKDSSNILPGHGGLFDRFDGMLGASLMLLLIEALIDFPPALA